MPRRLSCSPVCCLVLLAIFTLGLAGCGGNETHQPATNFSFQETNIPTAPALPPQAAPTAAPKPPPEAGRPQAPARMTLLEAIGRALQRNQKIQVSAYNPRKAAQDLKGAEAVYDSSVFSSANLARTNRPTSSLLDTGTLLETKLIEDKSYLRAGAKKFLPTGATVSVYQELNTLDSNSLFVVPNPQGTSGLVLEMSQPLLKGFWDRTNRAAIAIGKLNVDMSNEEFRQVVMDVVADVARVYWQLVLEREFEIIARRTLDMAVEVFRREKVRMERGISAQLDADRAQAAAEIRRGDLLRSESRVKMISDQLKLLLNLPEGLPEIIPVSKPVEKPATVEMDQAMKEALKYRPELARAKEAVGVSKERKDLAGNNRLPKLDAVLRLTKNGLGINAGRAIDTVYSRDNNSWLAGLEFEYPLGNRAAQAEYDKRSLEYDQSSTEVRRVKDQIINEVSLAIREIQLAQKEIPTTRQARDAAERVVASENVRFELGQKSNEELLRAQDLLAAAAREHARAVVNYNMSITALNRGKGTILQDLGIKIKE